MFAPRDTLEAIAPGAGMGARRALTAPRTSSPGAAGSELGQALMCAVVVVVVLAVIAAVVRYVRRRQCERRPPVP